MAKRLIGTGCRLGWSGVGRGMGVLDAGSDRQSSKLFQSYL